MTSQGNLSLRHLSVGVFCRSGKRELKFLSAETDLYVKYLLAETDLYAREKTVTGLNVLKLEMSEEKVCYGISRFFLHNVSDSRAVPGSVFRWRPMCELT